MGSLQVRLFLTYLVIIGVTLGLAAVSLFLLLGGYRDGELLFVGKVGTGELNRLLEAAYEKRHPPGRSGHKAKIYYGTQVGTSPPEFRLFVNDTALFPDDYKRYLENEIRAKFDCGEVPILVTFWRRESRFHD